MTARANRSPLEIILLICGISIILFAGRYLPPMTTQTANLSVDLGFTNNGGRIVALTYLIICASGLYHFTRTQISNLEPSVAASWRWFLLGALASAAWILFWWHMGWGGEGMLFVNRMRRMDLGQKPYIDFEYPYGLAFLYIPYAFHKAGLSVITAYYLAYLGLSTAGLFALFVIIRRFVKNPRFAVLLFLSFVAYQEFGIHAEGTTLSYCFARFSLAFLFMLWLIDAKNSGNGVAIFALANLGSIVAIAISAEAGVTFMLTLVALAAINFRLDIRFSAILLGATVFSMGAILLAFGTGVFSSILSYSNKGMSLPLEPSAFNIIYLIAVLVSGATAVATGLRRMTKVPGAKIDDAYMACGIFAIGLLPSVISFSEAGHIVYCGFVAMILTLALLERRALLAARIWLAALVFLIGIWNPAIGFTTAMRTHQFRHGPAICRKAYPALHLVFRTMTPVDCDTASPPPPQASKFPSLRDYLAQSPPVYDPFSLSVPAQLYSPKIYRGYFDGFSNVFSDREIARKLTELNRDSLYLLPVIPGLTIGQYTGPNARNIQAQWLEQPNTRIILDVDKEYSYVRLTNLIPFPATWRNHHGEDGILGFFRILYGQCQVIKRVDLGIICAHHKNLSF